MVALDKPIEENEAQLLQAAIQRRVLALVFDLTVNVISMNNMRK
jgi:hypothetical protein